MSKWTRVHVFPHVDSRSQPSCVLDQMTLLIISVENEAAEYFYGRGPSDVGMTTEFLGPRDLPRVNAKRTGGRAAGSVEDREGAVSPAPKDPTGSTAPLKPKPKAERLAITQFAHASSQPSAKAPPAKVAPRPGFGPWLITQKPTVVEPRPGYGPAAPAEWSQQSWGSSQWWGQEAWDYWEEAEWSQQWWS